MYFRARFRALLPAAILFLQSAASPRAAVSLTNGSFENTGTLYDPALGGLNGATGWTLLNSFQINASSAAASNPPNAEFTGGTPTGSRYLRLVSDLANNPNYRGAVAQNAGTMEAGKSYTLKADVFGGPSVGVDYGATVSFVSQVSVTPATTYATQTVSGVANGAFLADGIDLSYIATAADNGQPLVVLLLAQQNFSGAVAPRGGLDDLRLTTTVIVPDTTPPTLLSATAPWLQNLVILTFDEPVDLSAASFTIAGGTVSGFTAGTVPNTVLLTVTGLTAGSDYSVTANNVKDAAGNVRVNSTVGFTAAPPPGPVPIELVRPGREPVGPASRRGGIVISEINYHPADRADLANLEFVEICNTLPWAEDLGGFRLTGEISYAFPANTTVPAGGYLVVAAAPESVQTGYSLTGVLGPFTGALNNNGGTVRLRDYTDAVVFEVNYDSGHPWQPAADGAGHSLVLARPSYGMDNPKAWDMSFNMGGSPGAADPFPADPWRTVVINEIQATAAFPGDFIELYNYSSAAVDLSGCSLSDDRNAVKYLFPAASSIPAGGFIAVEADALGFGLKAGGDTVYFRAPGIGVAAGRVLDALRFGPQRSGTAYGRYPDGAAGFSTVDGESPGMSNHPPAGKEAVITEILYHPPSGSTQLPFVEITNTSGAALNLSGWRLRGGVNYDIPSGTTLAAGAPLAITAFSGSLNQGTGERIRLEKPVVNIDGAVTETIYPVIDEVTYSTGGRWGRDSDGGGPSLELKDLRSDGRLAANWADSTENNESNWVTLTNTGILDNGLPGALPNRLEVMLLGAGEVLIDNVELVQGAGANIVANSGFESGMTNWVADGTHNGSAVESGTGVGGSAAMHLRATGRGDLAGNRLLNTLTTTSATGITRTLRAQVKYLRGHPEILFRVHGGWLETTGNVLGNVVPGTAGAANSRAVANAGPAISGVTHLPVLPQSGEAAVVYAQISDPDGVSLPVLNYRIDPASTTTAVVMLPRGAGLYSAEVPAQTAGKLAAFSITATDGSGASTTFPPDAPAAECLIRWGEIQPAGNSLTTYRLWFTQATASTWASRLKNSNAPLDCTFVCGDYRVIYNAGAMYSGSPFHTPGFSSPTGNPCDYNVEVPSDDCFLGETDLLWSGPGTFGSDTTQIREQAAWWIARKMNLPSMHRRFVNVTVNGVRRGQVMEDSQQPNGAFLSEHFPGDSDGALHKAQDWIEYSDNGGGFTGPTLSRALLTPVRSAGQHKIAAYRYRWSVRSVEDSANDFTALTTLIDAFNTGASATDPAFFDVLDPILDQDSWSRSLAIQRIIGNWDTWGWSYGKNMYAYKPANGPWAMMPWDMDFGFGPDGSQAVNPPPDPATAPLFTNTSAYDPSSPGDPMATKFRTQPAFRRAYWCALLDAANGPMVPATFNARMDLLTAALTANGVPVSAAQLAQVKTYSSDRRNYIITQANAVYSTTTFALSGSSTINDADGVLTLAGTAPANVKTIRINGVEYTPQWTSETAWSLPLTLYSANNSLTIDALDLRGNVAGSFQVTISITGPPPVPPVTINEWMADNTRAGGFPDPADGQYEDWFELHNYGATGANIGGFFLTDTTTDKTQFSIPAGTLIPAGGYLLVWADDETIQNGLTPGQLHASFKLSADGEQIGLYTPDGTAVDLVSFPSQTADQSQGRYPDSTADVVFPVPTPGKRNALSPVILALTDAGNGTSTFTFSTEPTHAYQVETSIELGSWSSWGSPVAATAASISTNLPRNGQRRFWRARMLLP